MRPTLTIDINGTKHVLTFGLGFLRDIEREPRYQGDNFGGGLQLDFIKQRILLKLLSHDPLVIEDFIRYGTASNEIKPTSDEIESFIYENMATQTKENKLFMDFLTAFKDVPGVKNILAQAKKEEEKAKEKKVKDLKAEQ